MTFIALQVYIFINVFIGSILSFDINHKLGHILHIGPLIVKLARKLKGKKIDKKMKFFGNKGFHMDLRYF